MLSPKDLKDMFAEGSVERILGKAQKLSGKGRHDQAAQVIKEAIGRLGDDPDLRTELATLCLAQGRPREAAESLRALLKASAAHVPRVEEYVGWARTQFSDIEALWEPLAEGHVARRNLAAAFDCLERIGRKTLEAALEARLANLNRFLEKGAAVPRSAAPTLYVAALGYEATGDWQKALDCYRKILTAVPGDFPGVDERLRGLVGRHYKTTALRLQYAELLQSLGHQGRAREEQMKALEVDPRCADRVGRSLSEQLAAAPDEPELLWASVQVDLAGGRVAEALATCGRLVDAGLRIPEIEKILEEMSAAGKDSADTLFLLSRVASAQGKASRAVAAVVSAMGHEDAGERTLDAIERLVAAFPSEPRPYQILADLHLRRGRTSDCLATYRRLRAVDPSSSTAIVSRLEAVLVTDPGNMEAQALLEEVCIASGDPRSAVPFLRRRLRGGREAAVEVMSLLRPMLAAAPADDGLKLAAAEAALAGGDPEASWGFLQDLIKPEAQPDPGLLHMLVLCAGSSAQRLRDVESFVLSRAPGWAASPDLTFALAEGAGRAGLLREAVRGFKAAAAAAPETAPVCRDAMRALGRTAAAADPGERAAVAEALVDSGDLGAALEILRGVVSMPPAAGSTLAARLSEALRKDPRNLDLAGCLAQVCLAGGQVQRALEIARAGLAGREDAASAPLALTYGDALCKAGKQAEAVRAYAAAVTREGALAGAAMERLRAVLAADPGLESARMALGKLLINDGKLEEGVGELMAAWSIRADRGEAVLKDLDRIARRHAGHPVLDLARARLLTASGQGEAAAEVLGGPLAEDHDRLDEVLPLLEEIAARHPRTAKAHFELARACLRKGWLPRSCAALALAHRLDPSMGGSVRLLLSRMTEAYPEDPGPRLCRAALDESDGKLLPAAEAYLEATALGGEGMREGLTGLRRLCGRDGAPARAHLLR
ncbi:MAG TPA: tetratricopeptide repeat protein, partial [Candidatus Polarisedimenticolia bacterium]|nr:tetratricopeptide repeat protein [Candidatus Polarisedimenticolia bacterium]